MCGYFRRGMSFNNKKIIISNCHLTLTDQKLMFCIYPKINVAALKNMTFGRQSNKRCFLFSLYGHKRWQEIPVHAHPARWLVTKHWEENLCRQCTVNCGACSQTSKTVLFSYLFGWSVFGLTAYSLPLGVCYSVLSLIFPRPPSSYSSAVIHQLKAQPEISRGTVQLVEK